MAKKKQKAVDIKKYSLYLSYDLSESGGEIKEGQENEKWPEYEDVYIDFKPTGLFAKPGGWQETLDVTFDPNEHIQEDVYLVIVRYSDGDTFSNVSGKWNIPFATLSLNEAKKAQKKIEQGKWEGYCPWKGYFGGIESVEIWSSKIKSGECNGVRFF